jgi:hypothetical protein
MNHRAIENSIQQKTVCIVADRFFVRLVDSYGKPTTSLPLGGIAVRSGRRLLPSRSRMAPSAKPAPFFLCGSVPPC